MVHVTWGIVLAAGKSEQLSTGADSAFLNVGSSPLITRSLNALEHCPDIDGYIAVVPRERTDTVIALKRMFSYTRLKAIVETAGQRMTCLNAALKELPDEVSILTILDVANPTVNAKLITETIKAAKRYGCATAAVKVTDPVKLVEKGQKVTKTLDRSQLWQVYSPRTIKRDLLKKAFDKASAKKIKYEEETEAVEAVKGEVHLVSTDLSMMRITTPADLMRASAMPQ